MKNVKELTSATALESPPSLRRGGEGRGGVGAPLGVVLYKEGASRASLWARRQTPAPRPRAPQVQAPQGPARTLLRTHLTGSHGPLGPVLAFSPLRRCASWGLGQRSDFRRAKSKLGTELRPRPPARLPRACPWPSRSLSARTRPDAGTRLTVRGVTAASFPPRSAPPSPPPAGCQGRGHRRSPPRPLAPATERAKGREEAACCPPHTGARGHVLCD